MVIFWQSLLHVLKSHIEIKQEVKLLSGEVTKKRVNLWTVCPPKTTYFCSYQQD